MNRLTQLLVEKLQKALNKNDPSLKLLTIPVEEYHERYPVRIGLDYGPPDKPPLDEPRLVIVAENEAQYNSTAVDLLQLLAWVKKDYPEFWDMV